MTTEDVNPAAPTAKTTADGGTGVRSTEKSRRAGQKRAPAGGADARPEKEERKSVNVYLTPDVLDELDYIVFRVKRTDSGVSRSIWIEAAIELAVQPGNRAAVDAAAIRKAEEKRAANKED